MEEDIYVLGRLRTCAANNKTPFNHTSPKGGGGGRGAFDTKICY